MFLKGIETVDEYGGNFESFSELGFRCIIPKEYRGGTKGIIMPYGVNSGKRAGFVIFFSPYIPKNTQSQSGDRDFGFKICYKWPSYFNRLSPSEKQEDYIRWIAQEINSKGDKFSCDKTLDCSGAELELKVKLPKEWGDKVHYEMINEDTIGIADEVDDGTQDESRTIVYNSSAKGIDISRVDISMKLSLNDNY